MTMTREQTIQQLIEKEIWWLGTDLKNSNYNNLETNPYVPRFKIDRTDDGYFYTSDSLVSYCDLRTGEIFRIRRYWENKDWLCYNQLYQKGLELGFRIDIPLYKDTVEVNGEQWEYAEFRSPGNDYGKNYNDDVFLWPELTNGIVVNENIDPGFKNLVKSYYIDFVNQSYDILCTAKEIAVKEMTGLPLGLAYIFNRYRDDQGYFWSDFDQFTWTRTGTDVLNDSMLYLKGTLTFGVVCGVITEEQGIEVTNYAREKWAQI